MCFDQQPVTLTSGTKTLSDTQLPEWVSQAGRELFQAAANLVKPEYEQMLDESGNPLYQELLDDDGNVVTDDDGKTVYDTEQPVWDYDKPISKFKYTKPKLTQYTNIDYDYDGDGDIDAADSTAATAAGDLDKAKEITNSLATDSSFAPIPKNKLSIEEQMAGKLLTEGADSYEKFMSGADLNNDGVISDAEKAQSAEGFASQLGKGYLGTNEAGEPITYQDLSTDLLGEDFKIGKGTQAQKLIDIYSDAVDPAIQDIQKQTLLDQQAIRDKAAKAGAFGGSRLGISEALLGAESIQSQADMRKEALAEGLGFAAGRFDKDRQARFDADTAARSAYETEEASRLSAKGAYENLATLTQSLQEQAAAGLITTGEAKRVLDQKALDLAYAEFLDEKKEQYENINFALGALQGVPYNVQNLSYGITSNQEQGPSVYGQALGTLGTLGSAYFMGKGK
jgi:hypothetical protein